MPRETVGCRVFAVQTAVAPPDADLAVAEVQARAESLATGALVVPVPAEADAATVCPLCGGAGMELPGCPECHVAVAEVATAAVVVQPVETEGGDSVPNGDEPANTPAEPEPVAQPKPTTPARKPRGRKPKGAR